MLRLDSARNAAIDGGNWSLAAQCVLANTASIRLGEDLLKPLAQIATGVDIGEPVADVPRFVVGVAWLVDQMEVDHAGTI